MAKKFEKVVNDFVQTYGEQPEYVSERENQGQQSPRSKKQREQFFTTKSSINHEFPYWYTRQYMQDDGEIPVIRRARALKAAFSHLTPVIYPGELQVIKKARYFQGLISVALVDRIRLFARRRPLVQEIRGDRCHRRGRTDAVRRGRRQYDRKHRQGRLDCR